MKELSINKSRGLKNLRKDGYKYWKPVPRIIPKTRTQLLDLHIKNNDTLTGDDLSKMSYSGSLDKIVSLAAKRNNVLITNTSINKWVIERPDHMLE